MGIYVPAGYRLPPGTVERNRQFLQTETDNFGTFVSKDRVFYHMAQYNIGKVKAERELRALTGVRPTENLTGTVIHDVLSANFFVPDYKMTNREGRISMDKDVRAALIADPDITATARRIVELFDSYSANKYMVGYLGQYLDKGMDCKEPDADGERMLILHPVWNVLSTSRLSASEPSVQNINRDVQDIFSAPKGYALVHPDSGQIEPRITYSAYINDPLIMRLITVYDDAYFGLLHFITMSSTEEEAARCDLSSVQKHEVTEEMKAKRKRLKVLGLAGNYGSSNLSAVDAELGPLYEKKVVNHPMRRQWERSVSDQVRSGVGTFHAYFGTTVSPDQAKNVKYSPGSSAWVQHMVRCGINNPIQTTAAELMHISIMEVHRVMHYGEHVAGWIHDAGMFYVPLDKVDERAPVFQNCLAYDVEGWIPIGADLHIGREESGLAAPIF